MSRRGELKGRDCGPYVVTGFCDRIRDRGREPNAIDVGSRRTVWIRMGYDCRCSVLSHHFEGKGTRFQPRRPERKRSKSPGVPGTERGSFT